MDIRVKIRRQDEPDNPVAVARSHVMSEGGMGVYAPVSLEIGTYVLVEFLLPGTSRELRLHALVRNRRGFRCGMEFVKLAAADRLVLQHYLQVEGRDSAATTV
jgi:hypothetical protein